MALLSAPSISPAANMALAGAGIDPRAVTAAKARSAAQDFEAVLLNTMVSQMFTAIEGEGPFGGGSLGVWRSFLSEEYSKSFAKAGGIGIADHVYQSLLAQQEAQVRP
jgi:Rod binding domain-containing protein